jgi:hypothetical protein
VPKKLRSGAFSQKEMAGTLFSGKIVDFCFEEWAERLQLLAGESK